MVLYRSYKKYDKTKALKNHKLRIYGSFKEEINRLELAGTGNDGNNDYNFAKAVKKFARRNQNKDL